MTNIKGDKQLKKLNISIFFAIILILFFTSCGKVRSDSNISQSTESEEEVNLLTDEDDKSGEIILSVTPEVKAQLDAIKTYAPGDHIKSIEDRNYDIVE